MKNHQLLLGVNIDHVATLRQARYRDTGRVAGGFVEPDPLYAALIAEQAGADCITIHPREDQRHIQRKDLYRLRQSLQTRLNMEMACTQEMAEFAAEIHPDSVCLVPENRTEVTTEGGLDVVGQFERVRETVESMIAEGIKVSLFIDPDEEQIDCAAELNADMVELHTGAFANHYYDVQGRLELEKLVAAAIQGHELSLTVNAGHGINYVNISKILEIPHLHELNIGHSIVSRAIYFGLDEAVREMKSRMQL
ncbi:MAG: pyridoxine 5'-phosphate synthase [Opitutales bacterium]|nr:pyridoxine 5'-phosphate synthase [Opitutales bacterium]